MPLEPGDVCLPDFQSSEPVLHAFCQLASEEILAMPCPDIEQLKQIGESPYLNQ